MAGYGTAWPIEGPPPVRRRLGLLQAADAPAAGVRIVTDLDAGGVERWASSARVWPWPSTPASTWDACASSSQQDTKDTDDPVDLPEFFAFDVYLAVTCSAVGLHNDATYRARASAALDVAEGHAVEHEFLSGERMTNNPHLADGAGTFPNANTSTDVVNGLALLEVALGDRLGLVHMSPAVAVAASSRTVVSPDGGVLRTINGTPVIAGSGYDGRAPSGHTAKSGTKEWIYATGPVDVRRGAQRLVPDTLGEALDRETNTIRVYGERVYLVTWDTVVQAAVLVDRCATSC